MSVTQLMLQVPHTQESMARPVRSHEAGTSRMKRKLSCHFFTGT